MPTHEQVTDAAERVHGTGERVTQGRVLADLRLHEIGCSQRTIAEPLRLWLARHGHHARPAREVLPDPLQAVLGGFGARVWDAAIAEANARLDEQRTLLEREREAAGRLLDETQIRAEITSRENEELHARLARMTGEIAELRKEVVHLRRTEFWDRVIREIVEFLPEGEWMTTGEIARRVPPSLAKEALTRDKELTPGRIHRQMRIRDTHGRFYELNEEGEEPRYRRLPGWTGMTPLPPPRRKQRSG
ncbi:DNA-binding protein [Methylobacterium sp. J-001]|uniref:DNA-binding protein n=1 Tax=Methylobacterium sp. J-001 TaxID=2836609 RepID=UPI001FB884DA|nr:DNA-binding protein [Methylobacterium sp. J-001]MCJ2117022.1 DNA-binding protein [Methylobacterium sp. J-001]